MIKSATGKVLSKQNYMKNLLTKTKRLLLAAISLPLALLAQETVPFKGTVLTEKGDALAGVSVTAVQATDKQKLITVTNDKGIFQFAKLTGGTRYDFSFSHQGYETQVVKNFEIKLKEENVLLVRMKETTASLNDVVVIGYGSQQKRFLTGAASHVSSEKTKEYPASSFALQLSGKAAGVVINNVSAQPGTDPQIVIRGIGTLTAGRNPLIVVDGFPLSEGSSLNSINPQDIEAIDILKDPASAAIYGSRAANGVILVSTVKGKPETSKVNFDYYTGYQERADNVKYVNAYDAAIYLTEARDWAYVVKDPANRSVNDSRATRITKGASLRELRLNYIDPYLNKQAGLTDTYWLDETFRKAGLSSYNVSASGGSGRTNYYISGNYFSQDGIVINNDFKRYSSTIKVNARLSDKVDAGISINPSYIRQNYMVNNGNSSTDPIGATLISFPFFKPYNDDGTLAISKQIIANTPEDGPLGENPVAMAKMIKNIRSIFRAFGNAYVSVSPVKGLQLKSMIGTDITTTFYDMYNPSDLGAYRTAAPKPATATETNGNISNLLSENTVNYSTKFGAHDLNVLAGYTYQKEFGTATVINGSGIPDNNLPNIGGASAFNVTTAKYRWVQISYLARLQYAYRARYLLSLMARRDGSSRFGANSQWGNFPSVTAGWLFTKEDFFPSTNGVLTFGKLRATWGMSGNNQIVSYGSRSLVSGGAAYNYVFGSSLVSGFAASTTPNPDLSWETKTSTNIGIDLGLWNKFNLSADYYTTTTKDLLLNVPVPEQSGFSTSIQNIGKVQNTGFELELSGSAVKIGKISWDFSANLATNQNKVLALAPGQTQIIQGASSNIYTKVGGPVAELYGYRVVGIFKDQAAINSSPKLAGTLVGDYIVEDVNKDGTITAADMVAMGTYNPELTYGFSSSFGYRNFDLSFSFTGVKGRKIYDTQLSHNEEAGEGFTVPNTYYFQNRYHPEHNPNGFLGQPNNGSFSAARRSIRASDISYQDADYVRLRTFQISYRLPTRILSKFKISAARFFVNANNVFTITRYRGYNPDATTESVLTNGQANSNYPVARTFTAGFNLAL